MCVSAATRNLQEARKLEWESLQSDEEDELPSTRTLGLPVGGLGEEESDSEDANFSPVSAVFVSPHRSNAHRLAAGIEHEVHQLRKVLSSLL